MLNADGHLCVYIVMCVSVNYAWLISRAKRTAGHLRVIRIVTRDFAENKTREAAENKAMTRQSL